MRNFNRYINQKKVEYRKTVFENCVYSLKKASNGRDNIIYSLRSGLKKEIDIEKSIW